MSLETQNTLQSSKKVHFHIAKFNYHMLHTIPNLFISTSTPNDKPNIIKSKKGERNINYSYANYTTQGISILDSDVILQSAKKLYVCSQSIRMSDHTFKKSKSYKVPYLPIYGDFHQVIQFYLIDKSQKSSKSSRISKNRVKEVDQDNKLTLKSGNNYELYVIHHCQPNKQTSNTMKWQNFIQKYHFLDQINGDEIKHKINYSLIFNYQIQQNGVLDYFSSSCKLYMNFLNQYLVEKSDGLQNVNKMQGYLMSAQDRIDKKIKDQNDPSFQQTHKRWIKLPSEYYKQFLNIKKHTSSYYNSIHTSPKHSEHFINNLICRYMHANQYNFKQSLESTINYLKWQKEISQKYTLTMFAQLHKIDFFTYLGQDYDGRAVVLNRASHLKVDDIIDVQNYCNYYIYYLQIWLQKKLKGYSDQYTVIADVNGLGTSNFKLSITKRNVSDCLKYCPQRQYKMIAVNVGSFASFVWKFLQPLLPKRTISKLSIIGTDINQIVQVLTKEMDINIIPEYLGGKNSRIFSDDLEDQKKFIGSQIKQ